MTSFRVAAAGAFPTGGDIKTVTVSATGPAGANRFKAHTQQGPTGYRVGVNPTIQLAPTGAAGFKTIVIPGFTGAA
jgi:hypothetical protein